MNIQLSNDKLKWHRQIQASTVYQFYSLSITSLLFVKWYNYCKYITSVILSWCNVTLQLYYLPIINVAGYKITNSKIYKVQIKKYDKLSKWEGMAKPQDWLSTVSYSSNCTNTQSLRWCWNSHTWWRPIPPLPPFSVVGIGSWQGRDCGSNFIHLQEKNPSLGSF